MDDKTEEEEDDSENIINRGGLTTMWAGLVSMAVSEVVVELTASIAAVCEARRFMEEEAEHKITKCLLIEHVWNQHGEE